MKGSFSVFGVCLGCGLVCGGGVSLGAVVGWGWAGASLCRGGPVVVGLFSIKFEKWVAWKSIWPRGYQRGLKFREHPPLYRAVVSVDELYEALPFRQCRAFFLKCRCGWAGWVSAWAGVGCANVVDLTKRKPTSHDAGGCIMSNL